MLVPVQNRGDHGFGRAVLYGFDHMQGDAAVITMADESDDCRDVVRYWESLNVGWDCVFQSHGRNSPQIDCARLFLDGHSNYVAQPKNRRSKAQDQGNGKPLLIRLFVCLAGEIFQQRRLCKACLPYFAKP